MFSVSLEEYKTLVTHMVQTTKELFLYCNDALSSLLYRFLKTFFVLIDTLNSLFRWGIDCLSFDNVTV